MSKESKERGNEAPGLLESARSLLVRVVRRQPRAEPEPTGMRLASTLGTTLRLFTDRIVAVADFAASRLLELDVAAAELAAFVEGATERHGSLQVLRALVRHNLLLNGTFLGLLEPLLSGDPEAPLDEAALRRGRETMVELLLALARLDDPDAGTSGATVQARLEELSARGFASRCPGVWEWLQGCATPEEDRRFLFQSYLIFLQSFVLRSAARSLVDFPASAPQPTPGASTGDEAGDGD